MNIDNEYWWNSIILLFANSFCKFEYIIYDLITRRAIYSFRFRFCRTAERSDFHHSFRRRRIIRHSSFRIAGINRLEAGPQSIQDVSDQDQHYGSGPDCPKDLNGDGFGSIAAHLLVGA